MELSEKDIVFEPLHSKPKTYRIGSFDTETVGNKAAFHAGAAFIDEYYYREDNPKKLIEFMCLARFRDVRWFAHNLSYDMGVLFKFIEHKNKMLFLNGKILSTRVYPVKSRSALFLDSWRLSGGRSLKDIGDKIGLPKLETPGFLLPPELETGQVRKSDIEKKIELDKYLKRDVQIVHKYISLFQEEINNLGGELKFTLASTAMDLYRRKYLDVVQPTPFDYRNNFARLAYYGGRVEPFKTGLVQNVNVYDINSLYPYVMGKYEYPDLRTQVYINENCKEDYIFKYEGVSEVRVYVPDCYVPILPFRHDGILYFPVGNLQGVWSHVELREAVKRGAIIKEIIRQYYTLKTIRPFERWVNELYAIRLKYKELGDPRETVIKIMLNSLYGKFGQRDDTTLEELVDNEVFLSATNKSGYTDVILDGMLYWRKPIGRVRKNSYSLTLWAVYITSYARLELFSLLESAGNSLVYCDTDSIFTTGVLRTGKGLGELKLEASDISAYVIAPKLYQIREAGLEVYTKARGVPKKEQVAYLTSHEANYMRSIGFFEAQRRHLSPSEWVEVTKRIVEPTQKRRIIDVENNPLAFADSLPFRF